MGFLLLNKIVKKHKKNLIWWDCFGLALYRFTRANRTQSILLCSSGFGFRTQSNICSIKFDRFENGTHTKFGVRFWLDCQFYDNCRNSRALIGLFLLSICGQTHKFKIHATRQRARAGNSTICHRKKQIDVSFLMRLSCYWSWISSSHCQSSLRIHSAITSWIHSYFDNVLTKFMINNRTDAWKTDVNLLNLIEPNPWIEFDWVRFSNVRFTMPGLIKTEGEKRCVTTLTTAAKEISGGMER